MNIFKIEKRENPFVMIDKETISDINLTWKAKGILAYLLSLPPDWKIYLSELEKHARDGRDSLRSGLKELEDLGYIHSEQIRDESGKIIGVQRRVFEKPAKQTRQPTNGFSEIGKSNVGKPATTNIYNTNKHSTNIQEKHTGLHPHTQKVAENTENYTTDSYQERIQSIVHYYDKKKRESGFTDPLRPLRDSDKQDLNSLIIREGVDWVFDRIDVYFDEELYGSGDAQIQHFLDEEVQHYIDLKTR